MLGPPALAERRPTPPDKHRQAHRGAPPHLPATGPSTTLVLDRLTRALGALVAVRAPRFVAAHLWASTASTSGGGAGQGAGRRPAAAPGLRATPADSIWLDRRALQRRLRPAAADQEGARCPCDFVFDFGRVLFDWQPARLVRQVLPEVVTDATPAEHWVREVFQGYGGDWFEYDCGRIDPGPLAERHGRPRGSRCSSRAASSTACPITSRRCPRRGPAASR